MASRDAGWGRAVRAATVCNTYFLRSLNPSTPRKTNFSICTPFPLNTMLIIAAAWPPTKIQVYDRVCIQHCIVGGVGASLKLSIAGGGWHFASSHGWTLSTRSSQRGAEVACRESAGSASCRIMRGALWQDASLRALKAAGCDVALEIHQHNQRVDIVNWFAFMFHWSRAKMARQYVGFAITRRHPLDKTL